MEKEIKETIDKLKREHRLEKKEYIQLISRYKEAETAAYLAEEAVRIREPLYGKKVFIRGLIEFTNICKNNCYYCGIRRDNKKAERYRLTKEQIAECCRTGYELGFRTFVLQGGEDGYYSDEILCDIVRGIKREYPDCAVTLSVGERTKDSYRRLKAAGADRYLLRHETATEVHYRMLHPEEMSLSHRKECLHHLKELGYQTGCGFMVGSPYQTVEYLANDLMYIQELQPDMVGIGPFIPHRDTPYAGEQAGTAELTVFLLSVIRVLLPEVLLPATTALGTIDPLGREKGIKAGANVVMPNLSPRDCREKYRLYDNKICMGDEAAEGIRDLKRRMRSAGYEIVTDRGDPVNIESKHL